MKHFLHIRRIGHIVDEATRRGFKKAFICTDPDLVKFGVSAKVTSLLDEAGLKIMQYIRILRRIRPLQYVQTGVSAYQLG